MQAWLDAIELDDAGRIGGHFVEHLDDLGDTVAGVDAVAIDIPIGLPSAGRRQANEAARELLGHRRNSVFYTPVRDAITAASHAEASAMSKRVSGHGIS